VTRTTYYTATSLDGFIADDAATLEWLFRQDIDEDGPFNMKEFGATIGAAVMGSTTYEWVLKAEPGKWSFDVPTWVMTSRQLPLPEVPADAPAPDVRFASGDVRPVHEAMVAAAGDKVRWIVGGGELVGRFADAGLLDEVVVSIAPVTLGSGAPLLPRALDLHLEEVARNRDFTCARFSVPR
jgi:dihydrofolate reductase